AAAEADSGVAFGCQTRDQLPAEKAGGAGDEDATRMSHCRSNRSLGVTLGAALQRPDGPMQGLDPAPHRLFPRALVLVMFTPPLLHMGHQHAGAVRFVADADLDQVVEGGADFRLEFGRGYQQEESSA